MKFLYLILFCSILLHEAVQADDKKKTDVKEEKTEPPPKESKKTEPPPEESKKTEPPPEESKKNEPPPKESKKTEPPPSKKSEQAPPPAGDPSFISLLMESGKNLLGPLLDVAANFNIFDWF